MEPRLESWCRKNAAKVCNQKVTSGQYLLHIAHQPGTSEGAHTDGNHWVLDQYCTEGTPTHNAETSHKSSWQYGFSDLHLFRLLKRHLGGNWLAADANVKQAVTCWLQTLHTNFFYAATQALVGQIFMTTMWGLMCAMCYTWYHKSNSLWYEVLRISVCYLIFCNFLV